MELRWPFRRRDRAPEPLLLPSLVDPPVWVKRAKEVPGWRSESFEELPFTVLLDRPNWLYLVAMLGDRWVSVSRDGLGAFEVTVLLDNGELSTHRARTTGRACILAAQALGRWPGLVH
jgi:hypothetical protein